MLGYLFAIRLMRTGASNYVECGSLFTLSFEGLPPFAARACPRVLLASTWKRRCPIVAFAFANEITA